MAYLIGTNCLLRWAQRQHADNPVVQTALDVLQERGEPVCVTPQNFVEF